MMLILLQLQMMTTPVNYRVNGLLMISVTPPTQGQMQTSGCGDVGEP